MRHEDEHAEMHHQHQQSINWKKVLLRFVIVRMTISWIFQTSSVWIENSPPPSLKCTATSIRKRKLMQKKVFKRKQNSKYFLRRNEAELYASGGGVHFLFTMKIRCRNLNWSKPPFQRRSRVFVFLRGGVGGAAMGLLAAHTACFF